jgi:hypothetical protein
VHKQTLIDKYLPEYSFSEYHHTVVNSSVENVYDCARDVDMSKSTLIKALFSLRGLPTKRMNLQSFIADIGFTNIAEEYPAETLIGFWVKRKIEPIESHAAFRSNSISARVKVVWNFRFEKISDNQTKLSTETRVLCCNTFTKIVFGSYWLIIRPFSGLIRQKLLQIIKNDAESKERI